VGEAYTENCAGRREFAAPESWYSFEMQVEVDEGFNVHRSQNRSIRNGEDVKGLRSHQAVACTKRCIQELGRPIEALRGNERRKIAMLETRSTAETGLRWLPEIVSYCQESQEAGKADIGRRFNGGRIKHSTQGVGEPRTRGRT
jgi:hypothetical protein